MVVFLLFVQLFDFFQILCFPGGAVGRIIVYIIGIARVILAECTCKHKDTCLSTSSIAELRAYVKFILVVGEVMANLVSDYLSQESDGDLDPANRLKEMLKALYGFGEKHNKYVNYLIAHTLLEGDLGAAMMLIDHLMTGSQR